MLERLSQSARYALASLILLGLSLPALAAAETLRLDPARSKLSFVLGATGHDVEGSLVLESGSLTFDRATGEAGGEILIDAKGTQTGSGSRDKKMHTEVLKSAEFPRIVFRPTRIEGPLPVSGKARIGLCGQLGLIGLEHEIVLPADVEIEGGRVKASAAFEIPFVAWGLEDPSILFLKVDKVVAVKLAVEGDLAP